MIKLDLKDKKILYELDLDSKQSFQSLAKKIGLSKDATFYRVKRLEKEGIIKSFNAIADIGKLGFMSFRLFLKLKNVDIKKEEEIIGFLKKEKIVNWLVSIEGKWDIGMWLMCKSIKELNEFYNSLNKNYINFMDNEKLSIYTNVNYFSRAYFLPGKKNDKKFVFITEPKDIKIDPMDLEILKIITPNSRTPILDIAKKLNVSAKMISYRIKNLEKKKIIVGYRTTFDLEKLNILYYKLHIKLQNLDEKKRREFRGYIFQHPNIIYDDETIAGANIELDIQVKSVDEFRDIIKEIKNKFVDIVENYEVLEYLKEHKYTFLPV